MKGGLNMYSRVYAFLASTIAVPVVEQLPAASPIERLGKGTTQVVLACVVVGLAWAIVRLYNAQRKDWQKRFESLQGERREMQDVVAKNTAALESQSKSNHDLKEALYALREVIKS